MNRQHKAITRLPDCPTSNILWIVYNDDMVGYTQKMIEDIKGKDYMKFIKVVSRDHSSKEPGTVYFDPMFLDHIGNGNE